MNLEQEIKEVLSFAGSISEWRNNFNDERRIKASELSRKLYSDPFNRSRNCGCVDDFMKVLPHWNKEKIKLKLIQMESKFKLKEGAVEWFPSRRLHLTNDNLTDDRAIQMLKDFPSKIVAFETYPENWEKLTGKTKTKKAVKVEIEVEGRSRKEVLLSKDKEGLRILADELHNSKGVKKAHHKASESTLVQYILLNES